MLFLGAGASRAFDLPDLSEITNIIMKDISGESYFNKINSLKDALDKEYKEITKTNDKIDIEFLLTILNAINSNGSISLTNPFTLLVRLVKKEIGTLNTDEVNAFKDKVAQILQRELHIESKDKVRVNKITSLYDDLFDFIDAEYYFSSVVTTNYDNTFEIFSTISKQNEYKKIKKYINERGFKHDGSSEKFCLHTDPDTNVSFLKLHGSLDWWIDESAREITLSQTGDLYGKDLGKRLMIYPIHDKYISQFPFYYTYNSFKNILKEDQYPTVVIGYSFRDESINNAFRNRFLFETANTKKPYKMVVCTRSNEVENRVNDIFSGDDYRIEFLNLNFGENNFRKSLFDLL